MGRLIALLRLARRPLPFVLVVLPLAVLLGLVLRHQAHLLKSLGMAGLSLYLLPAIPIVMTSVAMAFDSIATHHNDRSFLGRLAGVTLATAVAAALVGMLCAWLWRAGHLSDAARLAVGSFVDQGSATIKIYLRSQPDVRDAQPLFDLILAWIVPDNLLKHITNNETLKVIAASVAFGLTIHRIPESLATPLRTLLAAVNRIAITLLDALLVASPLIIILLLASAVGQVNLAVLQSLLTFIAAIVTAALLTLVVAIALTQRHANRQRRQRLPSPSTPAGDPDGDAVHGSTDLFMLGLSTGSSITLFSSITRLLRQWGFRDQEVDTTIAINLLLARSGNIIYNMLAIIFAINFYAIPVSAGLLLQATLLAILTGIATAGLSGIAVVPVVALALDQLQIPSGPVIVLLLSIDPLLVMVRAGITGVVSLANATLICNRSDLSAQLAPLTPADLSAPCPSP